MHKRNVPNASQVTLAVVTMTVGATPEGGVKT
jgi:hypothetical protein